MLELLILISFGMSAFVADILFIITTQSGIEILNSLKFFVCQYEIRYNSKKKLDYEKQTKL